MTNEEYNNSPYMKMDTIVLSLYEAHFKYGIPLKHFRVSHDSDGDFVLVDVAQNYPYTLITIEDYFRK